MIKQTFWVGEEDWHITAFYDIDDAADLREVKTSLLTHGCPSWRTDEACWVLSMWNKGYTFTNYGRHETVVCISKATSAEQMYDSLQHELKHITEHISTYYDVDPKSEQAAYLQGEVARKMFRASAIVVCPYCGDM